MVVIGGRKRGGGGDNSIHKSGLKRTLCYCVQIKWACGRCTFVNEADHLCCGACSQEKVTTGCSQEKVTLEEEYISDIIERFAKAKPLRSLPNTSFMRPCVTATQETKLCAAYRDSANLVLANSCWLISGVWLVLGLESYDNAWNKKQFPELHAVMEAMTKPADELENAHRMMQLHVDLLLSKPIADIIVLGLNEKVPKVQHDPIDFVTALLKEVPEFRKLTKITRQQNVMRSCGCPDVSKDVEEHVRKRVGQGSCQGVLSTDQVWNFDLSGDIGNSDEKCPKVAQCRGGPIHQVTTHPADAEKYPAVLMFHVAKATYNPQLQFTPLEGLHYNLRSWTKHMKSNHHVSGVMMPKRVPRSTTNICVDDSDLTIRQNLPKGVSVAFYERITDVSPVVSSGLPAITKDIRFSKDFKSMLSKARNAWNEFVTKGTNSTEGGTATLVKRLSRRRKCPTQKFVPGVDTQPP